MSTNFKYHRRRLINVMSGILFGRSVWVWYNKLYCATTQLIK